MKKLYCFVQTTPYRDKIGFHYRDIGNFIITQPYTQMLNNGGATVL